MTQRLLQSPPLPTRHAWRWALPGLAAAALFAPVLSPSAAAQTANQPTVQAICEVNGGTARTVRVTYPAAAVSNVHVFKPLSGGANVVIHPPAAASQVYSLVVPAGRYRLSYATRMISGGYPPMMQNYGPVIIIAPFKIVGQKCLPTTQVLVGPSS